MSDCVRKLFNVRYAKITKVPPGDQKAAGVFLTPGCHLSEGKGDCRRMAASWTSRQVNLRATTQLGSGENQKSM